MPEIDEAEAGAADDAGTEASASGGSKNTDDAKGPVPYERFSEVNSERKALKEERDALARERDELRRASDEAKTAKARAAKPTNGEDLPMPPSGLSERQNAAWLIEHDTKRFLEREFGMGIEDIKTILSSVPEVSRTANLSQWERLCEKHGLDPSDQDTRDVFTGLGISAQQRGEKPDPEKIVQRVAKLRGTKPKSPPGPHEFEQTGVSRTVTVEDFLPADAKEATDAAAKGKRAPFLSTSDILRRKHQKRA